MAKKTRRKQGDRGLTLRDNPVARPPQISQWVVAFVDLLGYRSALAKFDVVPLPQQGLERDQVIKAFAHSVHLRRRLVGGIEAFNSTFALPSKEVEQLPPAGRNIAARL